MKCKECNIRRVISKFPPSCNGKCLECLSGLTRSKDREGWGKIDNCTAMRILRSERKKKCEEWSRSKPVNAGVCKIAEGVVGMWNSSSPVRLVNAEIFGEELCAAFLSYADRKMKANEKEELMEEIVFGIPVLSNGSTARSNRYDNQALKILSVIL